MGDNADVAVELEGLLPGHNLVVSFKIRYAGGVNGPPGQQKVRVCRDLGI
jgi:hypothetical protein